MHQDFDDPGPPRDWYEWVRPVARDLEAQGVPIALACYALALLDLTEIDGPPTPRVHWSAGWLYLQWQAGGRVLTLEIHRDCRSCYWGRYDGPRMLDSCRPLKADHAAVLRDLLLWLTQGVNVSVHPGSQAPEPRRKWWLP